MAVVAVYATPRRRLPRPGDWAEAQIDFRLITSISPTDADVLSVRLTGGFSLGTFLIRDTGVAFLSRLNGR